MPIYEDGVETVASSTVKEIEVGVGPFSSGVAHIIPGGREYTPSADGSNMDVYLNGQLLIEGASEDYIEDTSTTIKFNFNLGANSNLTYIIRC